MPTAEVASPGILRGSDSSRKDLNVTFEDSEQLDLAEILRQVDAGDSERYDELCMELGKGVLPTWQLSQLLLQVQQLPALLCGERHVQLVRALLACSWHYLPEPALTRYFSVVVLLATTQPQCASDAVKVLVHTLQYVAEWDPLRPEPVAGEFAAEEERIHALAVDSLCAILRVIPLAQDLLTQTLTQRQPYVKRPARQQAAYYSSLLLLSAALPGIRPLLLRIVYQRLVALDLLCPREELSEINERQTAAIEAAENANIDSAMPEVKQEPGVKVEPGIKLEPGLPALPAEPEVVELERPVEVEALDALMLVTLRHTQQQCYPNGTDQPLDWASTKVLYGDLLNIFEDVGLTTPTTAHAQFWLLWLVSRRPALAEHFLDWLWQRVQNPHSSAVLRQTCALYMGSLLARARCVDIELVRSTLELMCAWVHRYLSRQDGAARETANFTVHRPFYAVCQTVFYVFAFRHNELPPTESNLTFLRSLNYDHMVTSHLNPLRFCLPAVVQNFANVARHYQLAYCYTVIERNNRIRIPVVISTSYGMKRLSAEQLYCSYFPFDPYLLRNSAPLIRPCYREYAGTLCPDSDSESDDSDSEMEADADAASSLAMAEFNYSVSPGFTHVHR